MYKSKDPRQSENKKSMSKQKVSFPPTTSHFLLASRPHFAQPHCPNIFTGRTLKEKHPFLFQEKIHPRQIRNARSVFSFGVAGVLASAWGFLRAYASVSLHHARVACDIICFGNRFGFGKINPPQTN